MTKITLILIVNPEKYPKKALQNILKNTVYDFEIIFVNNSSDASNELNNLFRDDSRVIVKELLDSNLMQTLNEAIQESSGKYIIFTNSLNILTNDTLKRAYNKLEDKPADLLMFNQNNSETTIISRIVGDKTFDYKKIKDYLFSIDMSLHNFIYTKNFLVEKNIVFNSKHNDIRVFSYKSIVQANRILFFEKKLNNQNTHLNNNFNFETYLENLEEIQELIYLENDLQLSEQVNNFRINAAIEKFNLLNISSKKEAFSLLRNNFIKILLSKNSENYIDTLNKTNRKLFEQIIISESFEEYELLKKVADDSNYVNYKNRYEKILNVEYKKINDFNKSLTSSNSWKLTKFLRIGKKL